jgi:4-amino-4-deoxy-L-arabinose transferase-like glycosyltransferase
MHLSRATLAQAALVAALTGVFYARGLDLSPPHLTHDEIKFALQAKSVADTGRDINGRLLPVYFVEPGFSVGRDPLCIYFTAGVLSFLPLHESTIRLATVIIGALGVGLLFLLAALVFQSHVIALIAAAIMALSPTYFIHSRLALSVIYPVPFTILWLIVLHAYLDGRRPRTAVATGAVLGAGVYSYLAAAIMMPLYLLATCAVLAQHRDRPGIARVVAGFAVLLIPILLWQAVEPERYANIVKAYRLFEVQPGIEPAPVPVADDRVVSRRVNTFWEAFNPGGLFFTGESSLQISTREVGSMLTPVAVLLISGVWALRHSRGVLPPWLWLFGLVSAPLPAVIMADVEIRRWLVVLPFVAMIAGFGADRLRRGRPAHRVLLTVLVTLSIGQFALFMRDYFGPYRERSSTWFGGNIRAALTTVLDRARTEPPSKVYISEEIPWVEAYWRFYSMVNDQGALLERTQYVRVNSGIPPAAEHGAVLVAPVPTSDVGARLADAGWRDTTIIADLDGSPSLAVLKGSQ